MNLNLSHESFRLIWSQIQHLHTKNSLSDQELVGFFLFFWSIDLNPKTWRGPCKQFTSLSDQTSSRLIMSEVISLLDTQTSFISQKLILLLKKEPSEKKWIHWCCENYLQTTPHASISALKSWVAQPHQLKLMNYVPSPKEVLELQAQGTRCLSLVYNPNNHLKIVANEKDCFEFLTHDLIHADRFFRDQESAKTQRFFCQNILIIYDFPEIQNHLNSSEEFRTRFDYLTSDMNSHFIHLLKTFRALVESIPQKSAEALNPLTWNWIQENWEWTSTVKEPFLNLNTENETSAQHDLIFQTALSHL